MRALPALLLLVMVAVDPHHWEVNWTPHAANVALVVTVRCESGVRFMAENEFEITPEMDHAIVRRVDVDPDAKSCWALAQVVRIDEGATTEYVGEWTIVRME